MHMTMQQPLSYPFHMGTPRLPLPFSWPSIPYRLPTPIQQQYPSSYTTTQPRNFPLTLPPSSSSCSNTRYHQLKQSTSHSSRRSMRRSLAPTTRSYHYPANTDTTRTHRSRPYKTRSTTDIAQMSPLNSTHLRKAQSWHRMVNHQQTNMSVAYAKDVQLTPKRRRKHSPRKNKQNFPQKPPSLSPKRRPSFNSRRQQPIQVPECGVVRISTLDEMPINPSQTQKGTNSINNDRLSTKGSISNSSKRPVVSNERSVRHNLIKNRKIRNNNNEDEGRDSDIRSSSSSSSYSSLQQRLNNSLRHDPLITAAMKDFREHRRASSQSTLLTSHSRVLSRDSLGSDSIFHSPSLSSISHDQSQSNFTPAERSEIRQLIQTIQTKDTKISNPVLPSSPIPTETLSSVEQSVTRDSPPLAPVIKHRKSSIAEELDREFNKLRSRDPDQELTNVIPSSICKRKRIVEKPIQTLPPLPTFPELLRQVQLRPVENLAKTPKKKPTEDIYENPLTSIPVPVPHSSPIPSIETEIDDVKYEHAMNTNKPEETDKYDYALPMKKPEQTKHEYATPKKRVEERHLPPISHFQPSRNSNLIRSKTNSTAEKKSVRSLSMFNWFHSDLANQMPTTFQPHRILNHQNEYGTPSVEENIYTSDVKVHVPLPTSPELEDNSLQIHLDNQTILTDDFYTDYQTTPNTNASSILNDFSHLFKHKHKHPTKSPNKSHRCSIM